MQLRKSIAEAILPPETDKFDVLYDPGYLFFHFTQPHQTIQTVEDFIFIFSGVYRIQILLHGHFSTIGQYLLLEIIRNIFMTYSIAHLQDRLSETGNHHGIFSRSDEIFLIPQIDSKTKNTIPSLILDILGGFYDLHGFDTPPTVYHPDNEFIYPLSPQQVLGHQEETDIFQSGGIEHPERMRTFLSLGLGFFTKTVQTGMQDAKIFFGFPLPRDDIQIFRLSGHSVDIRQDTIYPLFPGLFR